MNEHVKSLLRTELSTGDLGDAIELLNVDLDDMIDAANGDADAIDRVREATEMATPQGLDLGYAIRDLTGFMSDEERAARLVRDTMKGYREEVEQTKREQARLNDSFSIGKLVADGLRSAYSPLKAEQRRFNDIIFEGTKNVDNFAETTRGAVDIALDPLNEGIETATSRLDKLFGLLSDQDAVDKFTDDLGALAEELANTAEGTSEYDRLMNDALQTVETLRTEHSNLSDAFLEGLALDIQTGDLEYALELIGKVQNYLEQGFAPGFEGLQIPQSMADLSAGGYVPKGMVSSVVINNNINPPAGSSPEEIANTIYSAADAGVFSSAVPIPTTSGYRN